jgi:hypothetical protein
MSSTQEISSATGRKVCLRAHSSTGRAAFQHQGPQKRATRRHGLLWTRRELAFNIADGPPRRARCRGIGRFSRENKFRSALIKPTTQSQSAQLEPSRRCSVSICKATMANRRSGIEVSHPHPGLSSSSWRPKHWNKNSGQPLVLFPPPYSPKWAYREFG